MKNKFVFIVLASTLLFFTRAGIADSNDKNYFGIQYGIGNYSEDGISQEFNPTALIGRFGYYFHPSFSIEGRLGLGLQDDTQFLSEFGVDGFDATLELDSIIGVYGTGHFNLNESFSIYGVLGVSKVKGTASLPSIPALESTEANSGISYGVGVDIGVGNNIALNIEYMQYLDKPDYDFGTIGLGVVFSF
jgi:opacity protein-like surface antigen